MTIIACAIISRRDDDIYYTYTRSFFILIVIKYFFILKRFIHCHIWGEGVTIYDKSIRDSCLFFIIEVYRIEY